MELASSSETLVSYRNTRRHRNSEELDLNHHHRENLKARIKYHFKADYT